MDDQPTCGQGLAEHSALPARLSELLGAMAAVLEVHATALDLDDPAAREEHAAYELLAREHRQLAAALATVADRMAGSRDLPMGRHDIAVMAGPLAVGAFAAFVERERELRSLLERWVARDEEMLALMRGQ